MLIVDAQVHIWSSGKPTNPNHRQVPVYSKDDVLAGDGRGRRGRGRSSIRPPRGIRTRTSWRWRPRASIPTGSPSWAISPSSGRRAGRWWTAGRSGPACSACASSSSSRISGAGPPTAPSTGSGPPPSARGCRSRSTPRTSCPRWGRWRSSIRDSSSSWIISAGRRATKDAAAWASLPEMLALAKYPNVAIKATGAPSYSSEPYPVPQYPRPPAPDLRRLRPRAHVLGHRHHAHALLVAAMRDALHRGAALADRPRQGADHGARGLRLAGLEASVSGGDR